MFSSFFTKSLEVSSTSPTKAIAHKILCQVRTTRPAVLVSQTRSSPGVTAFFGSLALLEGKSVGDTKKQVQEAGSIIPTQILRFANRSVVAILYLCSVTVNTELMVAAEHAHAPGPEDEKEKHTIV
ncbi:hypothetical protein C8Q76DRAFT_802757 [Earliella scabrosa]|nr:hypothetical protein C8Q76DRAFT_802757 [Earliella scabrosa]